MKHIQTWVIPDCPECGKEMQMYGRYDGDGFMHRKSWWECPECHHREPEVDGRLDYQREEKVLPND